VGRNARARLDAIKLACRNYIQDVLLRQLGNIAETAMANRASLPIWLASPLMETTGRQSLLFWYPTVSAERDPYVRRAIKGRIRR